MCAQKKKEKTFEMVACAQSICEGRAQCMTRDELMRCAPEVSAQVECSSYICLIQLDTLFMFAVSLIWRTRPHFLICCCLYKMVQRFLCRWRLMTFVFCRSAMGRRLFICLTSKSTHFSSERFPQRRGIILGAWLYLSISNGWELLY